MRILIERHVIEDALDRVGFDVEDNFRENYLGRGMYGRLGRQCIGIIGNMSDVLEFVVEMTRILEIEKCDEPHDANPHPIVTLLIENVCQDGMGLDSIYYWPGLGVSDD